MNFNSTAADALRGVNIGSFMNNPNPDENMRVYFAITPIEGWGRSNEATGRQFGLHGVDDFGRPRGREDDEVDNDDVVIIIMRCWQLHNRRCNNIVRRIVNMGVAYQVAYNEAKSEGLLWPLWKGSHKEKVFIEHMVVVVESSEELENMIENDIMKELERRVNKINEVQGVCKNSK